ncbi:ankyrin repeat domain-containing protein [bacterium]|nr:ankyrin repeat domain-containing protein [bacterium]
MKRVIVLLQFMFLVCSVSAGPIHLAAGGGNLTAVKAELDKGVDVNLEDDQRQTALHYAARYGFVEIASLLINNGADIDKKNYQGDSALIFAIEENSFSIVDLLIKKGADANSRTNRRIKYSDEPEKWIVSEDLTGLDLAAILRIDLWADFNSKKERRINSDIITILIENGGVWGGVETAVAGGDLAYVNQFLDEGGWVETVDVNDSTLLWYAASAGQYEIVKLLLAKGAHINAKNIYGNTPLNGAKANNCSVVYSYLRQNRAKLKGEIVPIDPENIPLQDAAKRLDLVERTLKGIQNLILDGPSGELSIKKLQGLFVISGQAGNRVEVQYHTGDNNWQEREIVTLQSNRQLYIDSSSFDEKRFYRIKKID